MDKSKRDYLIIGQGIAGTLLSYQLYKRGKSFHVVRSEMEKSSTYVSSGVINPVTGRRIVKTWMIDELLPTALKTYKEIGELLNIELILCSHIIKLISNTEEQNTWCSKANSPDSYLTDIDDKAEYQKYFKDFVMAGKIEPALVVNVKVLLKKWSEFLNRHNSLILKKLVANDLLIYEGGVELNGIQYSNVIFADGHNGMSQYYFCDLPYKNAKGEVLHIRTDEYESNEMVKAVTNIIPEDSGTYWVGSNYEWEADNDLPSDAGKNYILKRLSKMARFNFDVVGHSAGIRACSADRKPYLGQHEKFSFLWIMNGMGTKGISLAPYFSEHLLNHIEIGSGLLPEVDIKRVKSTVN